MRTNWSLKPAAAVLSAAILAMSACTNNPAPIASAAEHHEAPNIVIVLVDDLGWRDVSYNGSSFYETPAIDGLAADGIQFDSAYVAYPRCTPSRYALMTGRNPARAGIPGARSGETMEGSEFTIAEAFADAGYATFFAGKWHLGKTRDTQPEAQGFGVNIGGGSAGAVKSHFWPYAPENAGRIGPGLEQGEEGEYLADRLTQETIGFIRNHRNEKPDAPFFAVLSHYGVHTPLEAKPDLVDRFRKKLAKSGGPASPATAERDGRTKLHQDDPVYAAMIYSIDESVAKLRGELDRLGIAENTIIVFTSDHGGLSNTGSGRNRRLATSNLPLRAGKGHLYEGGIKVPLAIVWPDRIAPGQVSNVFVNNTDIFPTLLNLAGLPQHPKAHIDGRVVGSSDDGATGSTAFWHSPRPRPSSTGDRASSAIRQGNWKYILSYDPAMPDGLFDLGSDPGEMENLVDSDPKRAAALKGQLTDWLETINAVRPSLDRSGRDIVDDESE